MTVGAGMSVARWTLGGAGGGRSLDGATVPAPPSRAPDDDGHDSPISMRTLLLSCGVFSLLGLALSTGCIIVGGTGGSGANSAQSSSGGDFSDITGTARSTWLTDTGEQADLPESDFTVSAIYQKPD